MNTISDGTPRHSNRPTGHRMPHLLKPVLVAAAVYLLVAYVALPSYWKWHTRSLHPALVEIPQRTCTGDRIPGDPLNIAIVATQDELIRTMRLAGWFPADPITLESALKIAEGVVLHRPYPDAPVSNLYVWGRKEDLAFEQPVGHDPRRRHHVRFWKSDKTDASNRPAWIGSASFDTAVELSRTTGQITHHVAPDVDAERNKLVGDIQGTQAFDHLEWLTGFQSDSQGRNGGGDPYHTDRRLAVVYLRRLAPTTSTAPAQPATSTPSSKASPG